MLTCLSHTASVISAISIFGIMGTAFDYILEKLSSLNNSETHLCQLEHLHTLQEIWDLYLRTFKGEAVSRPGLRDAGGGR